MTAPYTWPFPVTLTADATVGRALQLMAGRGFRHIPLVDGAGRAEAILSVKDLLRYLTEFFPDDVLNPPK